MNKHIFFAVISITLVLMGNCTYGQSNYLEYHKGITQCEELIAQLKFNQAISSFDSLFDQYDFVFLRDLKLAAELSAYQEDTASAFRFIRQGIIHGWTWKSIKKNDTFSSFQDYPQWTKMESDYSALRIGYLEHLNLPLKKEVHEMFKKDQKKALGALLRIGDRAQAKYGEKKFAPHSEEQLKRLNGILDQYGLPGEQLIGNNVWASVILSHHNSISRDYNSKDSLYFNIRPKLMDAFKRGEMSPVVITVIEDWRTAGLSDHRNTKYGFLGSIPDDVTLQKVNDNRSHLGLRSVELRNRLLEVEKETGLNFYLPKDWQKGEIIVSDK